MIDAIKYTLQGIGEGLALIAFLVLLIGGLFAIGRLLYAVYDRITRRHGRITKGGY